MAEEIFSCYHNSLVGVSMKEKYEFILTPLELYHFMKSNFSYGYCTKNGKVIKPDQKDFYEKFYQEYSLQGNAEILNSFTGNCFDMVELERSWFQRHGYVVKTYFNMVCLDYENPYPMHTFLVYQDQNKSWNWFEVADEAHAGIHSFSSLSDLLSYQYSCYVNELKDYTIDSKELNSIIVKEYSCPKSGMSIEEFLSFVLEKE